MAENPDADLVARLRKVVEGQGLLMQEIRERDAEIAELQQERDQAIHSLDARHARFVELNAEIARLRAPPGADVMNIQQLNVPTPEEAKMRAYVVCYREGNPSNELQYLIFALKIIDELRALCASLSSELANVWQ